MKPAHFSPLLSTMCICFIFVESLYVCVVIGYKQNLFLALWKQKQLKDSFAVSGLKAKTDHRMR